MTINDIICQAYIKNGIIAPGEENSLDPSLGSYAIGQSNLVLEEFNVRSVMIYTFNILTFPLIARTLPTYWYTIGPVGADFTTPRPLWISRANIIITSSNPTSRMPLLIDNDMQWSDVTTPALGGAPYPTELYMNGDFPNARIYLWPYPTSTGNELELFVPNQISSFAALTDTFAFPPGFQNAFMLTLSEWLCEGFRAVPVSLQQSAAKARAYFASLNSAAPKISTTDSGMPGQRSDGGGNFYNGWPS
jgi:hypothetical protein